MTAARILPGFWGDRQSVNAETAIFHQWEQLEASGSITNFRLAAGEAEGVYEGLFFADSDASKWLDAASRVAAGHPSERLTALIDDFAGLVGRAQHADGYIYTYNQVNFPDSRWVNLLIEHELYCHGHLIEAGVSHHEATGRDDVLQIAKRAADRVVADFSGKGPAHTPGHQEIEIALMRLYRLTGDSDYLEMARQFIEQRGRSRGRAIAVLRQNSSVKKRAKAVTNRRQEYMAANDDFVPFRVPDGNEAKRPRNIWLRWAADALSGKYFQQHAPVRSQSVPVGHSVRFTYLETAMAMLASEDDDSSLLPPLERAWEHMVTRRMYVTGGIGSLPGTEGFGNDYELDPEIAYAETCAALGSMFWNWQMVQLTGKAQYSDLFEWQLYNAAGVGMGLGGDTYLYNNPLTCRGGIVRRSWYKVPCCPSNLSRTWADIGAHLFTNDAENIWVHQYADSEAVFAECGSAELRTTTGLPWHGGVRIEVIRAGTGDFGLHVRIPSWADEASVRVNGEKIVEPVPPAPRGEQTASGFDPRASRFFTIRHDWTGGDIVEVDFDTQIRLRSAHPKVRGHAGKVAVTSGPIVHCLESVDNPDVDIFSVQIDRATLAERFEPDLLGGTNVITGMSVDGAPLTFVPYHLWGNRGPSQMTVWVGA